MASGVKFTSDDGNTNMNSRPVTSVQYPQKPPVQKKHQLLFGLMALNVVVTIVLVIGAIRMAMEVSDLDSQVETLEAPREDILKLEKEISELRSQVATAKEERSKLDKAITDQTKSTEEAKSELKEISDQVATAKEERSKLEKAVTDQSETATESLSKLETAMSEQTKNIEEAKSELKEISDQAATAKEERVKLEKAITDQANSTEEAKSELKEISDQITDIQAKEKSQIYFSVGINTYKRIPEGETYIFDTTKTNAGDAYNTTTGVFTCPHTGYYLFQVYIVLSESEADHAHIGLYVNDREDPEFVIIMNSGGRSFQASGNSIVLRLQQGDTVAVKSWARSSLINYNMHSTILQSSFTGVLLSVD